jgi:copper chaperone CopZ
MTCEHCVRSVSNELGALPGVTSVDVDLPAGTVTVSSQQPLGSGMVRAAIREAGYELVDSS